MFKDAIQRFLDAWNERKHPFVWVKTADQVLRRSNRKPIFRTGALVLQRR
jgi:hypothetical protein